MQITKTVEGNCLTIALEGRLDTNTSPQLEAEMGAIAAAGELVFDLAKLSYISSAGLRMLLMAQKAMNAKNARMTIRNCSDDILDIFEVTGFVDILNIENA